CIARSLLRCAQTLASVKRARWIRATFIKFCGKMTHIRQGLRPPAGPRSWTARSIATARRSAPILPTSGALTRRGWLAGRQADDGAPSAALAAGCGLHGICAEPGTRTGRCRLGENSPTESRKRDLICSWVRQDILRGCSAGEVFDFFIFPGLASHPHRHLYIS